MWNEHCSYKSSKIHLKKLPTKNKKSKGPGENAGIVDIGDEDAIVFKIESHNHPSLSNLIKEQLLVLVGFLEMFSQWVRDQ